MAAVVLGQAFLSDAATPETAVRFYTADRKDQRSKPGEVRLYAGGRLRAVSKVGKRQALAVTARLLTRAEVELVDALVGRTVLFRDAWGRKTYGVFFDVEVVDYVERGLADVKFALQAVTYSEAV